MTLTAHPPCRIIYAMQTCKAFFIAIPCLYNRI
uniref:Uncharacterized protein n=1 Tax=Dulem virus 40 TaxID=3145758 RepID=A0AAU8AW73_9CAUD